MSDYIKRGDELIVRIKERAKIYTIDNLKNPSMRDFLMIENAMLIGSMVKTQMEMESE